MDFGSFFYIFYDYPSMIQPSIHNLIKSIPLEYFQIPKLEIFE